MTFKSLEVSSKYHRDNTAVTDVTPVGCYSVPGGVYHIIDHGIISVNAAGTNSEL